MTREYSYESYILLLLHQFVYTHCSVSLGLFQHEDGLLYIQIIFLICWLLKSNIITVFFCNYQGVGSFASTKTNHYNFKIVTMPGGIVVNVVSVVVKLWAMSLFFQWCVGSYGSTYIGTSTVFVSQTIIMLNQTNIPSLDGITLEREKVICVFIRLIICGDEVIQFILERERVKSEKLTEPRAE